MPTPAEYNYKPCICCDVLRPEAGLESYGVHLRCSNRSLCAALKNGECGPEASTEDATPVQIEAALAGRSK